MEKQSFEELKNALLAIAESVENNPIAKRVIVKIEFEKSSKAKTESK